MPSDTPTPGELAYTLEQLNAAVSNAYEQQRDPSYAKQMLLGFIRNNVYVLIAALRLTERMREALEQTRDRLRRNLGSDPKNQMAGDIEAIRSADAALRESEATDARTI